MNSIEYVWGIDPGTQGGIVVLDKDRNVIKSISISKYTRQDLADTLFVYGVTPSHVFFEKVGAMPKDRPKSAFAFGKATGVLFGILAAHGIPYTEVPPQTWQLKLALGGKWPNRKHAHQNKARLLFPGQNITLENCDGYLLAEYGHRILWR